MLCWTFVTRSILHVNRIHGYGHGEIYTLYTWLWIIPVDIPRYIHVNNPRCTWPWIPRYKKMWKNHKKFSRRGRWSLDEGFVSHRGTPVIIHETNDGMFDYQPSIDGVSPISGNLQKWWCFSLVFSRIQPGTGTPAPRSLPRSFLRKLLAEKELTIPEAPFLLLSLGHDRILY